MNKLTTAKFIENARRVHGDLYDYSKSKYLGSRQNIDIICKKHGLFQLRVTKHITEKKGCQKCSFEVMSQNNLRTQDYFLQKAKLIHKNTYDYSLVHYEGGINLIEIICKKHGVFLQTPNHHLAGRGCKKCAIEKSKSNTKDFIKKSKMLHLDFYNYDLVEYITAIKKVKIVCPKHGVFMQTPNTHLCGKGCPHCCTSTYENKIKNFLEKNKIKYIQQYKFKDCRGKVRPLPFDFVLINKKKEPIAAIEYQGRQHFFPVWGEENLKKTIQNDKTKIKYCKNNNLNFLKIDYREAKNIDFILNYFCLSIDKNH